MPNYDYHCEACGYKFEKFYTIANRNTPENEPCPSCSEMNVKQSPCSPAFGDAVRLGVKKPDKGFKEVLQKIHEKTPGSILNKNF
jgi:putative FmdB family regulatory protein